MLQALVLARCHVFTVFKGGEDSPKWAFFIDAAVTSWDDYIYSIYRYTSIAFQSVIRQILVDYLLKAYMTPILASKKTSIDYLAYRNRIPTFSWFLGFTWSLSLARVCRLEAENNCYLLHYHIIMLHILYYHITFSYQDQAATR